MADRKTSRSEDLKSRLRTLFSRSGTGGINSPTGTPPPSPAGAVPAALSDEMLRDMGQGSTLTVMQRIELIQAAREAVSAREQICSKPLAKLWLAVSDLANERETVAKEVMWLLMIDLLKYQPWKIGDLLEQFYSTIQENISSFAAEVGYKITALSLLTDEGINTDFVRQDFDIVLFQLMQETCKWNLAEQYVVAVELMNNAVRLVGGNWLSNEYRILIVKHVCSCCRCFASARRAGNPDRIDLEPSLRLVLNLLGNLSSTDEESSASNVALQTAETALIEILRCCCLLIADKRLFHLAWELAERMLSQPQLQAQLMEELRMLLTERSISDVLMVRGAVFIVGMALWGKDSIPSLSSPTNTRLMLHPIFSCLQRDFDSDASSYPSELAREKIREEVMLSVTRLLRKHPSFLTADPEPDESMDDGGSRWKIILEMVQHLVGLYLAGEMSGSTSNCVGNLSALLNTMESLHKQQEVPACHEPSLIDLFEACRPIITDDSIMYWMKLRIDLIFQLSLPEQVLKLRELIYMYHIRETRESVRLQAICLLISHYSRLHSLETEAQFSLLEEVTGAIFDNFPEIEDGDPVRVKVIQLFIVCIDELDRMSDTNDNRRNCLIIQFGNILTSILQDGRIESAEVESVVHEFIRIFMKTWQKNGVLSVCVRVFNQMRGLLQKLYFDRPISLKTLKKDEVARIRELKIKLFTFFLDFRCDKNGVLDHYSRISKERSLLFFQTPSDEDKSPSSPSCASRLCFQWVFKMLLQALQKELDWVVLRLVIEKLALHLDDRQLIVYFPDIITSASVSLCAMICERQLCFPEKLYEGPRLQQFHTYVLVPLTRLVSYAHLMDRSRQRQLIDCLCFGLVSSYNRECIGALTLALLEMSEAMKSVLSSIVLKLSQIASKPAISAYVLEFLSTLVHIPDLYRNFSEEGYLSIFAVAVPYTNPFRFNNYIVATAYRLIMAWFVKCRQPFRKTFANFIIKGLQSHVTRNFEEHERVENRRQDLSSVANVAGRSSLESSMTDQRRSRGKSLNVGFPKLKPIRGKTSIGSRSPGPSLVEQHDNPLSNTIPCTNSGIMKHISPPLMRKKCSVAVAPSATVAAGLHKELTEVCADMLARFAFSSVATMPRRSQLIEKLLDGGPRQSWLVGPAQVVTIQTCQDFPPGRDGLCTRCAAIFGWENEDDKSPPPSPPPFLRAAESCPPPVVEENLCWCSGLAEVTVHRPSGIVSWICRLQNPQISLEAASTVSSALPLEIAHLYRRTSRAADAPILSGHIREVQYQELHRQQFTDLSGSGASSDRDLGHTSSAAVPVRRSGLSTRSRLLGGSAEDLSPQDANPGEMARSPSMPDLSPADRDNYSCDEEVGIDGDIRNRSCTLAGVPNEKERISSRSTALSTKRRSIPSGSSYGLNPSFVFLQLYYSHAFGNPNKDILRPLPLPEKSDPIVAFSVGLLSENPVYEMHTIGVIYVGPGQANDESAIFANQCGSERYHEFLSRLGQPICLNRCDQRKQFVGGLDTKGGEDGEWTVVWNEDIIQLAFHVTTLMPPATSPANKHNKKRHVGNDYVTVVFNDSGDTYKLGTITGQFQFVNIVVEPLGGNYNRVRFITRDNGVAELLGSLHPRLVSDQALGRFIRVSALHANLASLILTRQRLDPASPFTNCWLERLRRIRRLRGAALKAINQQRSGDGAGIGERCRSEISEDFTDIVH